MTDMRRISKTRRRASRVLLYFVLLLTTFLLFFDHLKTCCENLCFFLDSPYDYLFIFRQNDSQYAHYFLHNFRHLKTTKTIENSSQLILYSCWGIGVRLRFGSCMFLNRLSLVIISLTIYLTTVSTTVVICIHCIYH
jgi:hypothetical protein